MTMQNVAYIAKPSFISLSVNNKPYMFDSSHEDFVAIIEACRAGDEDEVIKLATKKDQIVEMAMPLAEAGRVRVLENGIVMIDETVASAEVTELLVSMYNQGDDIIPLMRFFDNLCDNPLESARAELYKFIEAAGMLTITPDGCFLAYKKIRGDYKDIFSRKFDNSVGRVVKMDRSKCDPSRGNTCSVGLHFCSKSYLSSYGCGDGNRTVIVKINPSDVVSIPHDYNNAKGRCCKYEVVGEVNSDVKKPTELKTEVVDPKTTESFDTGTKCEEATAVSRQEIRDAYPDDRLMSMKNMELVALYNTIPGVNVIKKFRDKVTAVTRIKKVLDS